MLLEDQDRTLWDASRIAEGLRVLERALRAAPRRPVPAPGGDRGAARRGEATRDTDWAQIALLYARLAAVQPSPVVELNRAVAVAMAEGPEQGLALLDGLDIPGYHLLHAARADFLRRLDRRDEAAAAYSAALACEMNAADRDYLERRLAEITGRPAA